MSARREYHARVVVIAQIEVALGQIEHRPRIIGAAFDLGQQQIAIPRILLRIQVTAAEAPRVDVVLALEAFLDERVVACGPLVDDTLIAPRHCVAEQLPAPVGEAGSRAVAQVVDVGAQPAEVGSTHNQVVGVDDPDVVAVPLGESQCLGPVVAEIAPRSFVKFTRDTKAGHMAADHVLGSVVGAGIDDHPRRDVGRNRVEHLVDDVLFVTDDHVEADRGARAYRV
jgi:hypothetical protein